MKKPLAFKLMVDPKDIRRAVALITGEAITDEELNEQFIDREPIGIEPPGEEFATTAAFVALMLAEDVEKTDNRRKGKFDQKLDDLINNRK